MGQEGRGRALEAGAVVATQRSTCAGHGLVGEVAATGWWRDEEDRGGRRRSGRDKMKKV